VAVAAVLHLPISEKKIKILNAQLSATCCFKIFAQDVGDNNMQEQKCLDL
jgi:hypothetical protein